MLCVEMNTICFFGTYLSTEFFPFCVKMQILSSMKKKRVSTEFLVKRRIFSCSLTLLLFAFSRIMVDYQHKKQRTQFKFISNNLTLPGNAYKKLLPKRWYKLWMEKPKQEFDKVFKDCLKAEYS